MRENMAGVLGFEPRNDGTKNRCLTTWLHPNAKNRAKIPRLPLFCKALLGLGHRASDKLILRIDFSSFVGEDGAQF
jgi:hypothetical protein